MGCAVQAGWNSGAGTGAAGLQTAKAIVQTNVSAAGVQASICGNAPQSVGNAANTYANCSPYRDALGRKPNALRPAVPRRVGNPKSHTNFEALPLRGNRRHD